MGYDHFGPHQLLPPPLLPWAPPERMEERSRLDPAVDNLEPPMFVARGLVDRLGERLRLAGCAATMVRLGLEFEDAAEVEVPMRLRAPVSAADELATPVIGLLRRQELGASVGGIRLRLSGFCAAQSRQLDLLTRKQARLHDIIRQVEMLGATAPMPSIRTPKLALVPSLVDEARFSWMEPAVALLPPARLRKTASLSRGA